MILQDPGEPSAIQFQVGEDPFLGLHTGLCVGMLQVPLEGVHLALDEQAVAPLIEPAGRDQFWCGRLFSHGAPEDTEKVQVTGKDPAG